MKRIARRILCAALCAALAFSAAGCGAASSASSAAATATPAPTDAPSVFGDAASFDYANFTYSQGIDENGLWQGVRALDYVTLPADYASVSIPTEQITPTDADIQTAIDQLVSGYATVQSGDTVNIDYSGSVNGVKFIGGTASGYDLLIGSGTFISGFEDQIIGHRAGDTFDVTVTFPDGYSDTTDAAGNTIKLAGAEAVFSVRINSIKVGWALTDDWVAANLSEKYGLTTVDELKTRENTMLLAQNKQNFILSYLLKNSTFSSEPQVIVDHYVCQYLSYYSNCADYSGMTLTEYASAKAGCTSLNAFIDAQKDTLLTYIHTAMLYQAVAETAGLSADAATVQEYSQYVDSHGQNFVTQYALDQQVLDLLVKGAKIS